MTLVLHIPWWGRESVFLYSLVMCKMLLVLEIQKSLFKNDKNGKPNAEI
jgi:hypothetical protein